MKKKPRIKKNLGGRPSLPHDLRRVALSCRVPQLVLTGFEDRAKSHGLDANGHPNSSVGLEVERAFQATQPIP